MKKQLTSTGSPRQASPSSRAAQSFATTMHQARTHMRRPARAWSHLIHWRPLDIASNALGITVARPNAILYGSVVSICVTLSMYLIAKHYGYTLSGSESLVAFAIGWVIGIVIDYTHLLITGGRKR
ncbi:hypothetical protein GII36_01165 [Candidatus Mycosynbacter amalyticus]|uniref:Uncharacterized protein n=1 Tax=Candidatus Mycosynbacter amalyticus TaxID=2665156 RepID=A0A857MMS1_9BACT|nr:hypothetical protein [Candidatus Mycosynbacter amalyticus]QHN42461.1 hypothetical protein GII36_01165 [Candidatus Mycosynbacter amalyticus]